MRTISQVQQKTAPLPRGANFKVCVMSLAYVERLIDRLTPAYFLSLALTVAVASVLSFAG
jgi:hypothetical protein